MRPLAELRRDTRMYVSRALNRSLAPPDWLSINLTLRCNLSCAMCTTCYDAPELSREEIFDLIDQAAIWGVKIFNPLGGEPFVRQDLEDILAYAARRDFHVTLTTNGTLIKRPRADRVAAIPPDKLHINVSIDGLEAVHDRVRGAGAFVRTLEGYRHLRAADAARANSYRPICANVLLHRHNLAEFPALLARLAEEGFTAVQVLNLFRNPADPTAGGMWFGADQLDALERLCERLAAGDTPIPLLNRRADLLLVPRYYREGVGPLEAACWAGWKELYVNADGTAIMCDGKLDFLAGAYGDVRRSTLRELWASPRLRERRAVVKACTTPCIQNCYLRRDSDSLRTITREALAHLPLARRAPRKALPDTLTLELSDTGDTPDDPRLVRLFAESPVPIEAVWADPERLLELRDKHYLDFGRGFMGDAVIAKIIDDLGRAGLQFSAVALRWRGEPLLHPELQRVLRRLGQAVRDGVFGALRVDTSGRLLGDTAVGALNEARAEVFVHPGRWAERAPRVAGRVGRLVLEGPVVSWDARLARADDVLLRQPVGDVLAHRFGEVWEAWAPR